MIDSPMRALTAADLPARMTSTYPAEFAQRVAGRRKQALGDPFGIASFGINRVTLPPGVQSSIRHRHRVQDEFVYVLAGELILIDDFGELRLEPGMCAGFAHGGTAHHLINRSQADAVYLEIGDRTAGDVVDYPDDDLAVVTVDGRRRMAHKDGTPY